jgi:hypothetical protein
MPVNPQGYVPVLERRGTRFQQDQRKSHYLASHGMAEVTSAMRLLVARKTRKRRMLGRRHPALPGLTRALTYRGTMSAQTELELAHHPHTVDLTISRDRGVVIVAIPRSMWFSSSYWHVIQSLACALIGVQVSSGSCIGELFAMPNRSNKRLSKAIFRVKLLPRATDQYAQLSCRQCSPEATMKLQGCAAVQAKDPRHYAKLAPRSKLTNNPLWIPNSGDGRSSWSRRRRDVIREFIAEMTRRGRHIRPTDQMMIGQAASLVVRSEQLQAAVCRNDITLDDEWSRCPSGTAPMPKSARPLRTSSSTPLAIPSLTWMKTPGWRLRKSTSAVGTTWWAIDIRLATMS